MSITFFCPDAPKTEIPCPFCESERQYALENGTTPEKCHLGCCGTYMHSEAPECNFANANATELMRLVGLVPDCSGDIAVEKMGNLRQRILVALNRSRSREPLYRETVEYGGPGTGMCRCVEGANTDEQITRRLNSLLKLVVYAQEHNVSITWG